MQRRKCIQHGIGMIEIMVAVVVIGLGLVGVVSLFSYSLRIQNNERQRVRAAVYLEEGMEAVRAMRNESWAGIPVPGIYYLQLSGGAWSLTASNPGLIDGIYTRRIIVIPAYRAGGNLLDQGAGGGVVDPDSVKIRVEVTWAEGTQTKLEFIESYFTKWK